MEIKDIESFFSNIENSYVIGLFFALVVLLYITVTGIIIISTVTDKNANEEQETLNIKKIMDASKDTTWTIMLVFIGILLLTIFYFIYCYFNYNKNFIESLTNNKFTLSLLVVLCGVSWLMTLFFDYVKRIPDTVIADKNISSDDKSAAANDELTIQGLAMSIAGSIASVIVIALIVHFFYNKNLNLKK